MLQTTTMYKRARRRGSAMVEYSLVMLPLLGFVFLLLDLGWAIYSRSDLQYAVREGCRYAITGRTIVGLTDTAGHPYGQIDSIKYVVQHGANAFLGSKPTDPGWNLIRVRFYSPSDLTNALAPPTKQSDPPINVGGNLVEVSVEGYRLMPLMPLLRSAAALQFTARSADRMEATPIAGPPAYSTGGGY